MTHKSRRTYIINAIISFLEKINFESIKNVFLNTILSILLEKVFYYLKKFFLNCFHNTHLFHKVPVLKHRKLPDTKTLIRTEIQTYQAVSLIKVKELHSSSAVESISQIKSESQIIFLDYSTDSFIYL